MLEDYTFVEIRQLIDTHCVMINKSNNSITIAQELINTQDAGKCTISVHCCYYAVLQLIKFTLAERVSNKISYEEQREKSLGKGSHEYLINEIRNRISSRYAERTFMEQIRDLRQNRVLADYDIKFFTPEESLDIKYKADKLIYHISHNFNK